MAMPSRRGDGWPVSLPWPTKSNLLTVSKCRSEQGPLTTACQRRYGRTRRVPMHASGAIRSAGGRPVSARRGAAVDASSGRAVTATRPERPLMGRPDRCSARRGDSAQRRRVSANDLLVDDTTAGRARAVRARGRMRRARHRDEDEEEAQDDGPQREPVGPGARRARRRGAPGGGGRSATSRGSVGAPTVRPVISTVRRRDGAGSGVGASGAGAVDAVVVAAREAPAPLGAPSARSAACAAWRRPRGRCPDRRVAMGSPAWRSATARAAARASRRRPRRASFSRLRSSGSRRYCTSSHHARVRAGACRCRRPLSGAYGVS